MMGAAALGDGVEVGLDSGPGVLPVPGAQLVQIIDDQDGATAGHRELGQHLVDNDLAVELGRRGHGFGAAGRGPDRVRQREPVTLEETIAQYRGQAEKWIYPKIGKAKLKDLKAKDVERFLNDCGQALSKRSLLSIKSTLRRSIRRAHRHDLIGRNVAELADLPEGQPGRPSRAMTEQQGANVLRAATGKPLGYVRVVKIGNYRRAATHAATRDGTLACGTKPRNGTTAEQVSTDLTDATHEVS
jgi:Phage integrase, N-terminal SAM-like domain